MNMSAFIHLFCIIIAAVQVPANEQVVHYPEETHLANVRQLTFGGQNAEAYWSYDNKELIFQSANLFGTTCDQIYRMPIDDPSMIQRVSTGLGVTTCSFFMPGNKNMLYASTHLTGQLNCPDKLCRSHWATDNGTIEHLCKLGYTWDIYPDFDIYVANEYGNILYALTNSSGYDAEGTVSKKGDKIVFTSMRSGDLEIYTMNIDGSDVTQITNELGYDGGPFFNHDGTKIVFRASRPNTTEQIDEYIQLLQYNLVNPLDMELFVVDVSANGSTNEPRQITRLGRANWAPYYHPDNRRIIFSSNHQSANDSFNFNLFIVDEDGENLERVTWDPTFDAFPMFSWDGKRLAFVSARNATVEYELNLFVADWVESAASASTCVCCHFMLYCSLLLITFVFGIVNQN